MTAVLARDVFYGYPTPGGTVMALRGLSLTVAPEERVVVHGPNGSGKSTLIRLLLGDEPPGSGQIWIGGQELSRLDPDARRRVRLGGIGYVDQHAMRSLLPELTVRDNVALQLTLSGVSRKVARRAADVSLDDLGLAGLAGRATSGLSGGEAQRVAICAAVTHRPALILADEPTGELDAATADQVYDLLATAAAAHHSSLIMVSHDQRAERVAHRVVRIRDGRLSEQWTPGGGGAESLVVDDRGWVRIPADLRDAWPLGTTLAVAADNAIPGGGITLLPRWPVGIADRPTETLPPTAVGNGPPPSDPLRRALPKELDPVAEMSGIALSFGGRAVLSGVDLTVSPGRVLAVAGRSGSGKSSLLRILAGLTDPDRGAVVLGGVPMSGLDRADRARLRRRLVGVALQRTFLAETLTVRENMELARTVRRLPPDPARVRATADELQLGGFLHQPVRLLSGGERQRVAIARCLVVDRALLILDEPTSQQDEASAQVVVAALRRAADRAVAVVAATHDPAVVTLADEVRELGAE